MSAVYVLGVLVLLFYAVLWFFDSFFKSCMHYPYYAFLEGTGLKIGFFNFTWTTTAFNRFIYRSSKSLKHTLSKWFTCGYFVTVILFLPIALWTLTVFILKSFNYSVQSDNIPEVKAVLPGINIPISDFWIYFTTIAFSSVTHELGHAMAASQEDVQIISVGLFVFTIIPVAFVQLNSDHLNGLPINKRLKIYCAGIWHNIIIAIISLGLYYLTPSLFSIAFDTNMGVRVSALTNDSPLKQAKGLEKGDVINSINGCEIKNNIDWVNCLHKAHERFGICTTEEYISMNDELVMERIKDNIVECCHKENTAGLCFEYVEPKIPVQSSLRVHYTCLSPRNMLETQKIETCTEAMDYDCSNKKHCLKPSLGNYTYFIIIIREQGDLVLYLGMPYDLFKTVTVDQYFPKYKFLDVFSPAHFEKVFRYVFIFSMGIAFVNVIPCYGTDGHHIARNLIQIISRLLNKNEEFVSLLTVITVLIGTGVMVPMLMYLFYQAIMFDA